jgi:beta-lactamase class A
VNASTYTHLRFAVVAALTEALAAAALPGAAIRLIDLAGDRHYEAGGDGESYPASMIKVPLAVAAYAAAAEGRLALDERRPVAAANATFNDAPSPVVAGARLTIAELAHLAIDRSDNIATNELFDRVGRAYATETLARLGFPRTAFHRKLSGKDPLIDDPEATGRNTHPADEAAAIFAAIARGTVPGAEPIRTALAAQYWNTKLSGGLAPGDVFLHKTGDTSTVSHDGGILYAAGSAWVVVVYTQAPSPDEGDPRFVALMQTLRPSLAPR